MYKQFDKLLHEHNISAYKVAKETSIPTATLSDWKNGRSTPKVDKLLKIAKYFKVPITYFLDDSDNELENG